MFDVIYCHSKGAAKTRRLVLHGGSKKSGGLLFCSDRNEVKILDPPFIIETRMGINMEGRDVIW